MMISKIGLVAKGPSGFLLSFVHCLQEPSVAPMSVPLRTSHGASLCPSGFGMRSISCLPILMVVALILFFASVAGQSFFSVMNMLSVFMFVIL